MEKTPTWDPAFDGLLALMAEERGDKPKRGLIIDANYLNPVNMREDARQAAWDLIEHGLQTLKTDAISGGAGDLALACSRLSIRSSKLAKTLNVSPPVFAKNDDYTLSDVADDALAFDMIKILLSAAEHDLIESRPTMDKAFQFAKLRDAGGVNADKTTQKLFQKIAGVDPNPPAPFQENDVIHKQIGMMLPMMFEEYAKVQQIVSDLVAKFAPSQDRAPILRRTLKPPTNIF